MNVVGRQKLPTGGEQLVLMILVQESNSDILIFLDHTCFNMYFSG